MKAVVLLSGGMDSALATQMLLEQGVDIVGVFCSLPVISGRKDYAAHVAEELGISLIKVEAGDEYVDIIRNPAYGYGHRMNPCIDCRIYMLKQAKRIADEINASFVITGDVLGERTLSQTRRKLKLEERASGWENMIVRPLSAKLLPQTIPEREGWVDRNKLEHIRGKSRKPQIALAREFGIDGYRFPDSGCLLTCIEFAEKIRNLFAHKDRVTKRDILLLKIGRHFYASDAKVIVGRNEEDNRLLLEMKKPEDWVLEVPGIGSPITIIENPCDYKDIEHAAKLTARYSDANGGDVLVEYRRDGEKHSILIAAQHTSELQN